MKLILSGGGNEKQSKKVDSLFVSLLKNQRVLYIPIAMNEKKIPYDSCLEWCKSSLKVYGDVSVEMWTEEDIKTATYEILLEFGGIFIGGGNTFDLLNEFKQSGFDQKLIKLLQNTDIPILGGSAGALIFAKSIETIILYDENYINLTNFTGMNLVNGYNLWVHYEESMDKQIMEYSNRLNSGIIAIPEDSGIFIDNSKTSVVGESSIIIFPGKKIMQEGSTILK